MKIIDVLEDLKCPCMNIEAGTCSPVKPTPLPIRLTFVFSVRGVLLSFDITKVCFRITI